MQQADVGMTGPLVDAEGFPRSDIDVYAVRTARNRIIRERVGGWGCGHIIRHCGDGYVQLSKRGAFVAGAFYGLALSSSLQDVGVIGRNLISGFPCCVLWCV